MTTRITVLFVLSSLGITAQPKFIQQVLDADVAIGYGVAIGDVDGDKKPDVLLADKKQFVWYRNGDWKKFVMVENLTEMDNVCIAARDIDGDGKVEVAVGAQWNPGETNDTTRSGSVHFLNRPKDPTQKWTATEFFAEPTIHRMRWVKAGQKFHLVVVPLHGRGNKNGEGDGVKIFAYAMDGTKWSRQLVDQSLHMTHNFDVMPYGDGEQLVIGGKEGTRMFTYDGQRWTAFSKSSWLSNQSFGEIRFVKVGGEQGIVGVQPMHGNQVTIFSPSGKIVLTDSLNQGHALAVADVLGLGFDQVIAGWREPDTKGKVGIVMFVPAANKSGWKKYWLDNNDIACEDLQVADLDNDGRKDIIAAGRSTHNLKIYWNKSY